MDGKANQDDCTDLPDRQDDGASYELRAASRCTNPASHPIV